MRSVKKGFAIVLSLLMVLAVFPFVGVTNTAKAATVSNWVTCTNCSNYRASVNLIINGVSEGTNNYVDGTYEANISQYQVSSPVYLKSSLRPNSATIYVDRSYYSSLDQLGISVQLGSFSIHSNTGEVRWGVQIFGGHSGSPRTYLGSGAEYASSNGYNYYIYQNNSSHQGILSAETGDGNLNTGSSTSSRTDLTFGPYTWYLRGDAPAVGAAAYIDVAGVCCVTAGSGNYQMLTEWTHLSIVGTCSHSAGSHVGANYNGTHSYYCNVCGANVGTYSCSGGTATCTAQAVCTTCGAAYGSSLGHASNGTWMNDNGDVHYTYCTRCGTWLTSGAHTSNGAWMSDWADGHYTYCTACGRWLTSDVHHSNNAWVAADGNTHYTYCVDCGRWLSSGSHTFAWKNNGDGTHSYYCVDCGYVASTAAHSGGAATCTASPVCTTCGASYGSANGHTSNGTWMADNADVHYTYCTVCHEWLTSGSHRSNGSWVAVDGSTHRMYCPDCGRTMNTGNHTMAYKNNSDGTHSYYCRDCGYVASTAAHSGGTATCTAAPMCASCGASYDTQLGHSFTNYLSDNNATCLADGTKTAKCDRCDVTDTMTDTDSKLDHSYTGAPISNDDGTHSFKCENGCNEYGGTVGCTFAEWTTTTAPGCTTTGVKEHTCTVCGYKAEADIEADGHSYGDLIAVVPATCMAEGVKAHYECSVCHKYFDENKNELDSLVLPVDPAAHTGNNHTENYKDSTCTETGYTGDTVCECGVKVADGEEIALKAHEYTVYVGVDTEATCMANRKDTYKCANCTATTVKEIADSKDADNHTGNNHTENAAAATCTAKGYTGDTVCECGVTVVTGTEIDMLDHEYTVYVDVDTPATCMANRKDTYKCANCDATTAIEIADSKVATAHTSNNHTENAKDATCTEKGYTGDTVCECGVTVVTGTETDMLDHEYTVYVDVDTPATCMANRKDTYKCANCDATTVKEIADSKDATAHTGNNTYDVNKKAATCTEKGYTGDTVCECGVTVETGTEIDMLDHEYTVYVDVDTPATCMANRKDTYKCKNCDATTVKEIADSKNADNHTGNNTYEVGKKAATCTEKGYTGDTVCECGVTVVTGSETDMLDHEYTVYVDVDTPATCMANRKDTYKCANCDATTVKEIADSKDATAHTGNNTYDVNKKAATCTEKGYTGDTVCECGVTVVSGTEIDMLDHAYGEWTVTVPATCMAKGTERRDCANCDAYETRDIAVDPANHTGNNTYEVGKTAPSCTKTGYTGDTVCECGAILVKGKEIAVTPHDYELISEIPASFEYEGERVYKCADCGFENTEILPKSGTCEYCGTDHHFLLARIVCFLIKLIYRFIDYCRMINF